MKKYHIHILLIILGTILYFFAHFQRTGIPAPIFDMLQEDFNVSATKITALSAVFMYCYATGTLLSGFLIDKLGGIKILLYGSIIFSIGSIIFTHTTNLPALYLARGLIGFGAASFYLSIVSEVKKCFSDRYFGIVIAIVLFIGYLGGITANAPFIAISTKFGWQPILNIIAISSIFFTILYIITQYFFKPYHSDKKLEFSLEPYKTIFKNKNNYYLSTFYFLCTGLHYTIITVIGVKFLTDYMKYSIQKASFILSVLIVIAAFSGITLSTICKMIGNKRVLFLKLLSYLSFAIFGTIAFLVFFNIKTILIPILILILAINGGNTPITVPIAFNTNETEVRSTTLSIMNSTAFITVGIFATIIGFLLDLFPIAEKINGHNIYSNEAYFSVFLLFTFLALIEILITNKIKETT